MKKTYKKVLILGSGALQIGQAGEFDYSGSQAIKALKEEGITTVLVNPNIATIQTSDSLADKVYFLPVDAFFAEKIVEKERPDGIMLGFGGQTGLNVGLELYDAGVLEKFDIDVLGSPVEAIRNTEDRDLFANVLHAIDMKTPISKAVTSVDEAVDVAEELGYPVMARVAYALGGLGSGVAYNTEELVGLTTRGFAFAPQILIEEYLEGWKELEYEVVRDRYNNCIVVCSMENLDPMGIHTGESIVVAPVQTLTASENFKLRSISIAVIRHLGIIGECNIQFAFDPYSEDYRIIEVNARLSRSSALASKATGYPLAFIASKLALGQSLNEVQNMITQETSACFEPALDYIVLKFPRWDLKKFSKVSLRLGSQMKSVGEVMAIARSFEEVLQKAIRMLDIGVPGLACHTEKFDDLDRELSQPTDRRIFAVAEAFRQDYSVERVYELSKITRWFLYKIKYIIDLETHLADYSLQDIPFELLREAKRKGFSDKQLGDLTKRSEMEVREYRKNQGIVPSIKQIDTLAAEYPAKTNYLYMSYNGSEDDRGEEGEKQVVVLGGGAYRIGSSVEFDWCCVNSVMTLREQNYGTITINCNPETVSTDYDICDKLYFEEISFERVLDICEKEDPLGVIVSMGGQTPNNLAMPLDRSGVHILGTSPHDIDRAENRHTFSAMLDSIGVDQPEWKELTNLQEAREFAKSVGFPVLVRPSYVLSGAAMSIAETNEQLDEFLMKAADVSKEYPVVISKFITGAREIEIDAVAKDGELYCLAVSEHIENAGVHSGDASMVLPPQRTYLETMRRVKMIGGEVAKALNITGPFNMQFLAKDGDVKVIECNLRASRSFPFASKVFKMNFVDAATKVMMGQPVPKFDRSAFDLDYVGIKSPQFSFTRLQGSDPVSGVEMASTGEVGCLGDDFHEAFLKSLISVGFKLPKKNILLSTGPIENKVEFLPSLRLLADMGYCFYATGGTADFMKASGFEVNVLKWPLEKTEPNTLSYIADSKIDLVINIPKSGEKEELENDYLIRRKAVDSNVPLITNLQLAQRLAKTLSKTSIRDLQIKSWDEYQ
ncbi:MAG: carbamoyl-phosphate synthase (glutamine-hydrolyzing) large subunit [bacterium]|nr:carbamoyl-phosphate synthase (glutamine-hydrolyzing) large subunit [bacterium]